MQLNRNSILQQLVSELVRRGANVLDVEYKDGYDEIMAMKGNFGLGIARLQSSSLEAVSLRKELRSIARRKRNMTIDARKYEVCFRMYDSFGEDAYRLELRCTI